MVFNRMHFHPNHHLRDFFISQGLTPDIHFGDLPGPPIILVSADLNRGQPVFYGADLQQSVLDGVLASTALPPWVHPLEVEDRFLMDGGAISNLPIKPAILHGATEMIALDLPTRGEMDQEAHGFGPFWTKLLTTISDRQIYLEMELARVKGISVHLVELRTRPPVPIWDFSQTKFLLESGYQQMKSALEAGKIPSSSPSGNWLERLMNWFPIRKYEIRTEEQENLKAGKGI